MGGTLRARWVLWSRDFSWHMGAFKALMAGVKGSMWQAIRVWQILLMQRMEGNWTITPALANVLRAGEPLVDLADNMPTYDPEHLVTTIPGPLLSTCMRHATAGNRRFAPVGMCDVLFRIVFCLKFRKAFQKDFLGFGR